MGISASCSQPFPRPPRTSLTLELLPKHGQEDCEVDGPWSFLHHGFQLLILDIYATWRGKGEESKESPAVSSAPTVPPSLPGTTHLLGKLQGEHWSLQAAVSTLIPPPKLPRKLSKPLCIFLSQTKTTTNKQASNQRLEAVQHREARVSCTPGTQEPWNSTWSQRALRFPGPQNSTHIGTLVNQLQLFPKPSCFILSVLPCSPAYQ